MLYRSRRYARWVVRGLLSELWSNLGPAKRFAGPPVVAHEGCALVTGGTGAIGEAVCHGLAARGYDVIVGARDAARGAAVADALAEAYGVSARADVRDLNDGAAAKELAASERVSLLVNNAGVMGVARDETLRVNLVAPARLALAVVEREPTARVVNVASSSHLRAAAVRLDRLADDGVDASLEVYAESKLGVMQLTAALREAGVDARACHPGLVWTPMLRGFFGDRLCRLLAPVRTRLFRTPEQGAATLLAAALDPLPDDRADPLPYFVDGKLAPAARSPEATAWAPLWDAALGPALADDPDIRATRVAQRMRRGPG